MVARQIIGPPDQVPKSVTAAHRDRPGSACHSIVGDDRR